MITFDTLQSSDYYAPYVALFVLQTLAVAYFSIAMTLSAIYLVYLVAKFPLECWRWLRLNVRSFDVLLFGEPPRRHEKQH
jgi:hypothetical protein